MSFPPADLVCPDPAGCPVVVSIPPVDVVPLRAGAALYRVYDGARGYDEHNPGYGDTRFAPFDALVTGARVPTMYLAATEVAAMLETVFHDVHHTAGRAIYERDLLGTLLSRDEMPTDAAVADLRDPELARLGIDRDRLIATPAEHYPCTRRVAADLHAHLTPRIDGIVWDSRQAELTGVGPVEVLILFGDRYPSGRGSWQLRPPGLSALHEGPGRLKLDEIAETLNATIHP